MLRSHGWNRGKIKRRLWGSTFGKEDTTTQSGKAGAFQSLSQDQGTKLEGLMTSLQMHDASIDENVENISEGLGGAIDTINKIKRIPTVCRKIYDEIVEIKRDGLKMK